MEDEHIFISKSQFIKGLQCLKYLYLFKYNPELKDETPESKEAIYQSGIDIGILAQSLLPDGISIPYDDVSFDEQMKLTFDAIKAGCGAIYEATFFKDNLFAKVDILSREKGGWAINEVKGSTQAKDVHYNDIAFQYHVLNSMGITVKKANVVHINNEYERVGELELDKLFVIENITEDVKSMQEEIKKNISQQRELTEGNIPDIDIGDHCSDPYECEFAGHCWKHIPDPSVFSIRGRGVGALEFYKRGIINLEDIPQNDIPAHAQRQVKAYLEKGTYIDKKSIKEFLGTIWYPIAFLDFETFMSAVPPFDYVKPYEQIPFQYSLHVQKDKNEELEHYKYLAEPNIDPRKTLIEKLISEIPKGSCVVAYNMAFEKRILNRLAEVFPQHEKAICRITDNMMDLMVPFKNQAFYSWQMMGSYSLKAVLPVLVPELSYDELEVGDGGMAMDAYFKMCNSNKEEEINNIRRALFEYCHLDTLAMVKLLDRLREMVELP